MDRVCPREPKFWGTDFRRSFPLGTVKCWRDGRGCSPHAYLPLRLLGWHSCRASWHSYHHFPAVSRLMSLKQETQLPKGWWLKWSHQQPKYSPGSFYSQQRLSKYSQGNSGSDSSWPRQKCPKARTKSKVPAKRAGQQKWRLSSQPLHNLCSYCIKM